MSHRSRAIQDFWCNRVSASIDGPFYLILRPSDNSTVRHRLDRSVRRLRCLRENPPASCLSGPP
ncbi:hypothetical protein LIA77_08713 [Sarocladium implicatum]|nr:hypothetical protein LIA77_08713 [Sarocladium implicatum]